MREVNTVATFGAVIHDVLIYQSTRHMLILAVETRLIQLLPLKFFAQLAGEHWSGHAHFSVHNKEGFRSFSFYSVLLSLIS